MKVIGDCTTKNVEVDIDPRYAMYQIRKAYLRSRGLPEDAEIKNGQWVIDPDRWSVNHETGARLAAAQQVWEADIEFDAALNTIHEFLTKEARSK